MIRERPITAPEAFAILDQLFAQPVISYVCELAGELIDLFGVDPQLLEDSLPPREQALYCIEAGVQAFQQFFWLAMAGAVVLVARWNHKE